MAKTRDVSMESGKGLVDDNVSDLSGVDRLPLGNNSEDIGNAWETCINNSGQSVLYSNSELMFVDEMSFPDPGQKVNCVTTECNASLFAQSYTVKKNLNNETDLKKVDLNHALESDCLESGLSTPHTSRLHNSPNSDMVIDSPPVPSLLNNTMCEVQSIEKKGNSSGEFISPLKVLHDDFSDGQHSPMLSLSPRKIPRGLELYNDLDRFNDSFKYKKPRKPVKLFGSNETKIQMPKDFNFSQKRMPSTPNRNVRMPGLHNFLDSPSHVRTRLLASPVGRKLDFDCAPNSSTPKPMRSLEKMNNTAPGPIELHSTPMDLFLPRKCKGESFTIIDKTRLHLWVNPFSPAGKTIISDIRSVQERSRRSRYDGSCTMEGDYQDCMSPKKLKLSCTNSRYKQEFVELEEIGTGEHGFVYKCLNLINGLIYAIKISKNKVKRGYTLETAQNELYAHGVLEHKNIVRNYSSWVEDGYVYIQNEYCNRGNLESYMKDHLVIGNKAKKLMYDLASALRYMHNMRLVHLDVKPGNIFVHEVEAEINDLSDSDSDDETEVSHVTFKLGDFGHIIHLDNLRNLEEGDCRYMARELLNEDKTDLTKADIFSLALSVYEAAGGGNGAELPKNGDGWHILRDGGLRTLPSLSDDMNLLLKNMTNPELTKRPSATEICKLLAPDKKTEKLKEEIQSKCQKIAVLEAKQRERNCYIKQLKEQSLKLIQATDEIHAPRCTEKLPGKKNKRHSTIHFV